MFYPELGTRNQYRMFPRLSRAVPAFVGRFAWQTKKDRVAKRTGRQIDP